MPQQSCFTEPGTPKLEYEAIRGFRSDSILHSPLQIGKGFAGRAAQTYKTIHIPDLSVMQEDANQPLPIEAEGFKVYYGVPLIAKGLVKGVLEVFLRADRPIDQDRLEFLEALAGQAAIAIDNSSFI